MSDLPVDFQDIEAAAARLSGVAHRTPVLCSSALNAMLDAEIFLKCENLQRVGAFKFRGAYNAISHFDAQQRRAGAVTFSSGNHAQAVALASSLLGVRATIVMPKDAPAIKLAAARDYGAEVIVYDRFKDDRQAITRELAERRGMVFVPPYDDPHVIAGQGTAAKEFMEDVGLLDVLLTPVGGGGLISGCAIAAKSMSPEVTVYGVEPEASDDGQQSLRVGRKIKIETVPDTIADGARTQELGDLTFTIIQALVSDIVTVNDRGLSTTMRFLAERMKLVVEPTGCLPLAALSAPGMAERVRGKRVGIVLSGGNVDASQFSRLCAA